LNKPNIAFTANAKVPLEMFLSIHSGYSFSLDETHLNFFPDQTNLLLTANYMRQAEYNRLDFGHRIQTINSGVIAATNPEGNNHFLANLLVQFS
jgi:hypothetical protein